MPCPWPSAGVTSEEQAAAAATTIASASTKESVLSWSKVGASIVGPGEQKQCEALESRAFPGAEIRRRRSGELRGAFFAPTRSPGRPLVFLDDRRRSAGFDSHPV